MAELVKWTVLALLAAAAAARAEGGAIADPTLPPPGYDARQRAGADWPVQPEPIRLQMIAGAGASRLAVVNGQRVKAGDTIRVDGRPVQILAIRDDSVLLERAGQRQAIRIAPRVPNGIVCSPHRCSAGCPNQAPGGAQ